MNVNLFSDSPVWRACPFRNEERVRSTKAVRKECYYDTHVEAQNQIDFFLNLLGRVARLRIFSKPICIATHCTSYPMMKVEIAYCCYVLAEVGLHIRQTTLGSVLIIFTPAPTLLHITGYLRCDTIHNYIIYNVI